MSTAPLKVTVHAARSLPAADVNGKSDPFVEIHLGRVTHKTKTIKKTLNPSWNEVFTFHPGYNLRTDVLIVLVYDWDRFSKNDLIAQANIPLSRLLTKGTCDEWFQLSDKQFKQIGGSIHLGIVYGNGIGPEENQAPPPQVHAQPPPQVYSQPPPPMSYAPPPQAYSQLPPPTMSYTPPPMHVAPPTLAQPSQAPYVPPPTVSAPPPAAGPPRYTGPTYGLANNDVIDAQSKFWAYDTDHSGTIDRNELKPLLRICFGNKMSEGLMERFASGQLQSADTDKSGAIDFKEFLELYAKLKKML